MTDLPGRGIVVVSENVPATGIDKIEDAIVKAPIHPVGADKRPVDLAARPVDIDAIERAGRIAIRLIQ